MKFPLLPDQNLAECVSEFRADPKKFRIGHGHTKQKLFWSHFGTEQSIGSRIEGGSRRVPAPTVTAMALAHVLDLPAFSELPAFCKSLRGVEEAHRMRDSIAPPEYRSQNGFWGLLAMAQSSGSMYERKGRSVSSPREYAMSAMVYLLLTHSDRASQVFTLFAQLQKAIRGEVVTGDLLYALAEGLSITAEQKDATV